MPNFFAQNWYEKVWKHRILLSLGLRNLPQVILLQFKFPIEVLQPWQFNVNDIKKLIILTRQCFSELPSCQATLLSLSRQCKHLLKHCFTCIPWLKVTNLFQWTCQKRKCYFEPFCDLLITMHVVYFEQLSGAVGTRKLFNILFWPFLYFFFSDEKTDELMKVVSF